MIGKLWLEDKTYLDIKPIPSLKHGSENIMIYECVATNGVGNLNFIDTTNTVLRYIDMFGQKLFRRVTKLGLEITILEIILQLQSN